MDKGFDICEIMKLMPHRYPFILIDRILELNVGKNIVALKNVTINENFFQGHFPENPVMPGVLIIEALAQACGSLMMKSVSPDKKGLLYITGIDKVRLRKTVVPGDQLIIEAEFTHFRSNAAKMKGTVKVDGKVCVEGILMAIMGA